MSRELWINEPSQTTEVAHNRMNQDLEAPGTLILISEVPWRPSSKVERSQKRDVLKHGPSPPNPLLPLLSKCEQPSIWWQTLIKCGERRHLIGDGWGHERRAVPSDKGGTEEIQWGNSLWEGVWSFFQYL